MFNLFKALKTPKIHVAAIAVLNGDKILMGKRRDTNLWTNVGGHVEDGETPIQGAIRELKEESGIDAKPSQLKFLGYKDVTTIDNKKIRVHGYSLKYSGPTTMLDDPDEEVWRWQWVDLKAMPNEVMDNLHAKKNILLEKLGAQRIKKSPRKRVIEKSLSPQEMVDLAKTRYEITDLEKAKSFPVGTIRTYKNGKKYKKQANGDWVEVKKGKESKGDWHDDLKKSNKDKGTILVNKKGQKFVIEGWDKEYKEWFGRELDANNKPHGDEFGFAPSEKLSIHKEHSVDDVQTALETKKKTGKTTDKNPREEANEKQKELDDDYAFARKSKVGNKGEDLKGSARHKRNEFKNLEEIEKSGRGSELITRDNLIKLFPIDVLDGINKDNMAKKVVAYLILKKFPAKPDMPKYLNEKSDRIYKIEAENRETGEIKLISEYSAQRLEGAWKVNNKIQEKDWMRYERDQYYNAFMDFKKWIEETANDDSKKLTVVEFLNQAVAKILPYYRDIRIGGTSQKYSKKQAKLPVGYVNHTIDSRYGQTRKGTTVMGVMKKIDDNVINTEKGLSEEQQIEVMTRIIEGESIDKALGIAVEGKKRDDFKPQNLYLGKAEMKGQKSTGLNTQKQQEKFLMDKTKMRGLQWGNSVTDSEREHHMKFASNAFNDLTEILGLPTEMGSFNGRLGLAIGARGKGSALAHYEPSTLVINLTRKNGVGSLAHEWGHFFDNILAKLTTKGDFVSKRSSYGFYASDNDHPAVTAMTELFKSDGMKEFRDSLRDTMYEMNMGQAKRNYWASGHEIFARCFEKYVYHKLEKAGKKNTYLCKDVDHGLWPTKEQVEAMTPHFDKIFAEFKKSDLLKKAMDFMGNKIIFDLTKGPKIKTVNGVQYYASGKHAGKKVGTVRGSSDGKTKYDESVNNFIQKTNIPDFDDMIKNPKHYRDNKGIEFKISQMSPDNYISKVARNYFEQMKGTKYAFKTIEEAKNHLIKTRMKNTEALDEIRNFKEIYMPSLRYDKDGTLYQEGLHRSLVAKERGLKTIPVMTIFPKGKSDLAKSIKTDLHKEEPYFANKQWHYPKKDAYSSERKAEWHKNQMDNHDSDSVEYKSHYAAHKRWKKQDELGKSLLVSKGTRFIIKVERPL